MKVRRQAPANALATIWHELPPVQLFSLSFFSAAWAALGSARGPEQVLIDLAEESPVYQESMEARFKFYYEMHERVLKAAGGLVEFTHIGEDLGTQRGPVMSRCAFEKLF